MQALTRVRGAKIGQRHRANEPGPGVVNELDKRHVESQGSGLQNRAFGLGA